MEAIRVLRVEVLCITSEALQVDMLKYQLQKLECAKSAYLWVTVGCLWSHLVTFPYIWLPFLTFGYLSLPLVTFPYFWLPFLTVP